MGCSIIGEREGEEEDKEFLIEEKVTVKLLLKVIDPAHACRSQYNVATDKTESYIVWRWISQQLCVPTSWRGGVKLSDERTGDRDSVLGVGELLLGGNLESV